MSGPLTLPDPDDAIHASGAWQHRTVSANGARFHLVEAGTGPLVLLLHGFPTYWYTWRDQVPALAAAGYRVVAMDLRGYGGSDKTPHGYDPLSLADDVTGLIRSLGAREAVIVGHGWGGLLAWTMAAARPGVTRAIAAMSMPHPTRLREALKHDREQRRAGRYVLSYQLPFIPERRLTEHQGARVAAILRSRSADDSWLTEHTEGMFRSAMLEQASAHCALEYHRWAIRSIPRRDGKAFVEALDTPVAVPVLQIHGRHDPSILPSSVAGSGDHVIGPYVEHWLDTGHYVHEERPAEVTAALTGWLATL